MKELGSSASCRKFDVVFGDRVEGIPDVTGFESGANLEGKAQRIGAENAYADAAT